jgi:hypothetical protein
MQLRTYIEFEKCNWRSQGQTYSVSLIKNGLKQKTEDGFSFHQLQAMIRLFDAAGIPAEEHKPGAMSAPNQRR